MSNSYKGRAVIVVAIGDGMITPRFELEGLTVDEVALVSIYLRDMQIRLDEYISKLIRKGENSVHEEL